MTTKEKAKEKAKAKFRDELKGLIFQKCDEINHFVAGVDSPFTQTEIASVHEHLCEILYDIGELKRSEEVKK